MLMRIREARADDAPVIVDFQLRMAWETERLRLDKSTVERGVNAVFTDTTKGKYYVAEAEGQLVACLITVPEWSDWRCGTVLWIHSVFVVPAFRRQGAFRRLYEHLRRQVVEDPDLKGLRLYVDKRNAPAKHVYESLGMDGNHYTLYEWLDTPEVCDA
jgi:GNAT superfamily N-acetyltransferase